MKRKLFKEIKILRRDVARNFAELLIVRRELATLRNEKCEKTITMMQTSVREMFALSREL